MLSVLRDTLEILKRNNVLSEHCLQKEYLQFSASNTTHFVEGSNLVTKDFK